MKQKGFTLIELIGVIVILSLIIIIGYPLMMSGIESSEENLSEANEQFIFSVTEDYLDKYVDDVDPETGKNYPRKVSNVYCVSTETLRKEGFLSDSFVSKQLEGNNYIIEVTVISNKTNEYSLEEPENCSEVRNN